MAVMHTDSVGLHGSTAPTRRETPGIGPLFLLLYAALSLRQRVKSARFCASWYDLSLKQRKRLKSAFQRDAVFFWSISVGSRRSDRPLLGLRRSVRREKDRRLSLRSAVLGLMLWRRVMLSRSVSRCVASARRMRFSF